MKVFAIRHKPTQRFMPVPKGKHGSGSSFWEPSETPDGTMPRLFNTKRKASCSLTQWLRGRHEVVTERTHSDDGFGHSWDEPVGTAVTHDPNRIPADMEIVTFELKETHTHIK